MNSIEKRMLLLYFLRKEKVNELLSSYSLVYEDYQVIFALHYSDDLSIEDISHMIRIEKSLILQSLEKLKKKELIEEKDGHIYLSERAKELYPTLKRIVRKFDQHISKQLDKNVQKEVIRLLDQMIDVYEES